VFLIPVVPASGDRDKVACPRQSRSFGALRVYEVGRQDFALLIAGAAANPDIGREQPRQPTSVNC
jgi:hypothetical protein